MIIALIGAKALYLLFAWLASAIAASYLSGRKGYGEKVGLASGLILTVVGVVVWLVWPARPNSDWKVIGAFGRPKAAEDLEDPAAPREPVGGDGPSGTPG